MESLATKSSTIHICVGSHLRLLPPFALLAAGLLLVLWLARWGQPDALAPRTYTTHAQSTLLRNGLPNQAQPLQSAISKTLVLIYAVGDNDLSGSMLRLLNAAEQSADNPNLAIWMLLDGPGEQDSMLYQLQPDSDPACPSYSDFSCAGRYTEGQNRWSWSEESARPESITHFITQALSLSGNPTQLIVALVGHGSGWSPQRQPIAQIQSSGEPFPGTPGWWQPKYGGFLLDLTPQISSLSTTALGEALQPERLGRSIDLLYLDACSMSLFEVAYELRDSAHYLLASPNWGWAAFPYDQFLSEETIPASDLDVRTIGERWMRIEADTLAADHYPFTLALSDLSQMAALRAATDQLANALQSGLPANRTLLSTLASQSARYDRDYDGILDRWDSYVDLADFARRVAQGVDDPASQAAAQVLQTVLASTLVSQSLVSGTPWNFPDQVWDWPEAGGLAIYLPLNPDQDEWQRKDYTDSALQSARDGTWDELLHSWWNSDAAGGPACEDACPPPAPIPPQDVSDNDDLYSYSYHLFSDPLVPHVGQPTNLFLTLHRQGGKQTVEAIKVRFFLGYPFANDGAADDALIGESEIHFLNPRGSDQSTLSVWTPAAAGDYTICARIDPTKRLLEDQEANNVICRTLPVLPAHLDQLVPQVDGLSLADLTQQTAQTAVTLSLQASDGTLDPGRSVGATGQAIRALAWVDARFNPATASWIAVERSGWSAYSDRPTVRLSPAPGLHYLQLWLQDGAGNLSAQAAQLPVNYLPPSANLTQNQAHSFRYHLQAGDRLKVTLTPLAGDPDLYIWPPQTVTPPLWSSSETAGVDALERIAPESGDYQIEVYGFSDAQYQIAVEITQLASNDFTGTPFNHPSDSSKAPPLPAIPLGSTPGLTAFVPRPPALPTDTQTSFSLFLPVIQG